MNLAKWGSLVLAAPGILLAVVSAGALALAPFGRHPWWPHEQTNLAESAGLRDEAGVIGLIRQGEDPNGRYPIRPGLIFDFPLSLTPLEVAAAVGDPLMVNHLLMNGAVIDGAGWNYLRCIAERDDVFAALDRYRPSGAALDCTGVTPPWVRDVEQ